MENQENNNSFEDKKKNLIDRANKKYSEFLDKNNSKKDEKIDIKKPNIVDKAKSFASSMISKGLDDKKADELTKKLRVLTVTEMAPNNFHPVRNDKTARSIKILSIVVLVDVVTSKEHNLLV